MDKGRGFRMQHAGLKAHSPQGNLHSVWCKVLMRPFPSQMQMGIAKPFYNLYRCSTSLFESQTTLLKPWNNPEETIINFEYIDWIDYSSSPTPFYLFCQDADRRPRSQLFERQWRRATLACFQELGERLLGFAVWGSGF